MRFSNLARNALNGHRGWPEQCCSRPRVLRSRHRRRRRSWSRHSLLLGEGAWTERIAIVENSWLGGGDTGRNTTIIRSNYLQEESEAIYEHSMKLWETLSDELNYNVMYSPRGS